ncbi:hypothetical protein PRUPE_2G095800 [Prunus persica]|uniref:Uncharacterized protein n=1 Tax=Prunus persica TaxID=3760 RepID=M5X5H1_PRUPE|nr:hypothetical protein PRUPE_2G095800 [Prunus persica]
MRHINCNNEKEKPELNLMTIVALPPEILIDILSRLPVNSICCMRCVSKAFLKTVEDLSLAKMHMQRRFLTTCSTTTTEVPRLVVLDESPCDNYDLLYPLKYDGHDLLTKSKQATVSYFGSRRRFYCATFVFCNLFGFTGLNPEHKRSCFTRLNLEHGRSCLLVNPFKGEVLILPSMSDVQVQSNSLCDVDWYGMGFDNITNSFKIVRVSTNKKDYMVAEVLVLGTSSWRELPTVPPCFPTCKSTYAHGDMHWLVHGDDKSSVRILSFNFQKEEFYLTPPPASLGKKPDLWKFLHLLNFRGSLALVNVYSPEDRDIKTWGRQVVEIWGLKNYDNKEWMLHYKLDLKQDLFVPLKPTSLSKCGEWKHGIFFNDDSDCSTYTFFVDLRHISMKYVLLKGKMAIHSCTNSLICLKNYGDLVEAEEPKIKKNKNKGINEFPMSQRTWRNLIKAAEVSGRDLFYLKTKTKSARISYDENDLFD